MEADGGALGDDTLLLLQVPHGLRFDSSSWPNGRAAIYYLCMRERIDMLCPELRHLLYTKWTQFGTCCREIVAVQAQPDCSSATSHLNKTPCACFIRTNTVVTRTGLPCFITRTIVNFFVLSVISGWSTMTFSQDHNEVVTWWSQQELWWVVAVWVCLGTLLVRRQYFAALLWPFTACGRMCRGCPCMPGHRDSRLTAGDFRCMSEKREGWPSSLGATVYSGQKCHLHNNDGTPGVGVRAPEMCVGLFLDRAVYLGVFVLSLIGTVFFAANFIASEGGSVCPADAESYVRAMRWMHQAQALCMVYGWLGWGLFLLLGISRRTGVLTMVVWRILKSDFMQFIYIFSVTLWAMSLGNVALQRTDDGLCTNSTVASGISKNLRIGQILYIGLMGERAFCLVAAFVYLTRSNSFSSSSFAFVFLPIICFGFWMCYRSWPAFSCRHSLIIRHDFVLMNVLRLNLK
eukprot:SAG11_NODE_1350_length_5137_cov_2.743152_3_plen_460_part_00